MSSPEYVIIQAGGKGTRLKHHTANKPKAIVSVDNLPMIFHLFRKYPDSKFIVIGDYLKSVLDSYLDHFADVLYYTVGTDGKSGTCSGIQNAIRIIPNGKRFMLIWSDLILGDDFVYPEQDWNYIGISKVFPCRWSYSEGVFSEVSSADRGVAGLFVFKDKSLIDDVPCEGEFVRWLQHKKIIFEDLPLFSTSEHGLVETLSSSQSGKCRPFNSMRKDGNVIIKEGIDSLGKKLAVREKAWYKHVENYGVSIPQIYSFDPLVMEAIDGKNIFEYDFSLDIKERVLIEIMGALKQLHSFDKSPVNHFSMYDAYYKKTMGRLNSVRNLIPHSNEPYIVINGRRCRNVFFHIDEFRARIKELRCDEFCLIHGDCTFSNMLLRDSSSPVFIDPRGYFGLTEIVGDPNYDWAKLYYSLFGDYDQFNLGRFRLDFTNNGVLLDIESNGWRDLEKCFITNLPDEVDIQDIRFIHAIIWLSLTTYAWDDYDSICGAFYNGLYYLEESL